MSLRLIDEHEKDPFSYQQRLRPGRQMTTASRLWVAAGLAPGAGLINPAIGLEPGRLTLYRPLHRSLKTGSAGPGIHPPPAP